MTVKKISISMDRDLYARLQAAANKQKRTFSNFISHIAETMLPAYEKSPTNQTPILYVKKSRTKRT
jgi:metal-responsive CopG/Arc/MetJ family transcriptional regulator